MDSHRRCGGPYLPCYKTQIDQRAYSRRISQPGHNKSVRPGDRPDSPSIPLVACTRLSVEGCFGGNGAAFSGRK